MRLDKYLKVSRIIKRRTLSKEMAESERVYCDKSCSVKGTRFER